MTGDVGPIGQSIERDYPGDYGPLKLVALALARRLDDPEAKGIASTAKTLESILLDLDSMVRVSSEPDQVAADEVEEEVTVPDVVTELERARASRRAAGS